MKNLIFNKLTLTLLLVISIVACFSSSDSDKYECKDCVDTPEANPAYDNSNQGVYKGVLTGSAGTFGIYIDNDGDGKIVLKWEFEGDSGEITGTVSGTGPYTYTFSLGRIDLAIVIEADGTINSATFSYNGVDKKITVFKETSTSLVKCYKGSYSGGNSYGDKSSGTWNLVYQSKNGLEGIYYESIYEWGPVSGNTDGNSISLDIYKQLTGTKIGIAVGNFSSNGDALSGTWQTDNLESGSWKGKRYR